MAVYGGVESMQDALRYIFGQDGLQWERSFARATFLLSDQYWPSSPYGYKLVNLALHIVSALLLFCVIFVFLGRTSSALVKAGGVSILWALLPMHVTTVLYVVQRMTILVALLSLLALYFLLIAASARRVFTRYCCLGLGVIASILALCAKENAAVLLLLVPLIYFYRESATNFIARWQSGFIAILPLLFVALMVVTAWVTWGQYEGREFSGLDRLLSQGPILFFYVFQTFWVFDSYTLFHDGDWVASLPWYIGAIAWILHAWVVKLSLDKLSKGNLLAVGILWFYAGHAVESTIIPLELMFEHRNYLPAVGIVMCCVHVITVCYAKIRSKGFSALVALAMPLVGGLIAILALIYQCAIWSDYRVLSSKWAADHPNSIRAQSYFVAMLDENGLTPMAYDKLEEVIARNKEPSLLMRRYYFGCKLSLNNNSLDLKVLSAMNFTTGVLFETKRILESGDPCLMSGIPGGYSALIKTVEGMPLLAGRKNYYASFNDIAASAFIKHGNYSAAVRAREAAWQLQPSVPTALKLAELFILGGDPDNASIYLNAAVDLDRARWFSDDDTRQSIVRLVELLSTQKGVN